ncbi:secretory phospholipase A2 receptor-like, partial [Saccoglossus kowalevskii]
SSYDDCGVEGRGVLHNGTCFHLIKEAHSWDYANLACTRVGGRLATIVDRNTQLFLRHLALLSGSTESWWFGLHYDADENGMVYSDQTLIQNKTMFTSQTAQSGNCTVLDYEYNYSWKYTDCTDNNFFICQEDIKADTGCPYGWGMSEANIFHIFLKDSFSESYSQSLQVCEIAGASLVNISNEPTNQFVVDLIQSSCVNCSGYAWIGNLVEDSSNRFENWAFNNITYENECPSIEITEGVWYTRNCTDILPFVCSISAIT